MVNILKFRTSKFLKKWHMQTVKTKISLLLKESDYDLLFKTLLHKKQYIGQKGKE